MKPGSSLRARIEKLIFLFLNQNRSMLWHPKHVRKLIGKKIVTVLRVYLNLWKHLKVIIACLEEMKQRFESK